MAALTAKIARNSNRGSKPGERRGGRAKGTPNKLTGALKEMILEALDKAGGVDYLLTQADENPTAFLTLVGKIIPTQLTGDPENPVAFADVSQDAERVGALIAQLAARADSATLQ